ncbi:hypothetical protein CDL15_Pgr002700 [Punica granatum]|uniref:Uncharacterized protein n=1 Tax=Punica granatum TaxID=22663 RepID=A0A218Y0D5_PUNGR|nr:hypothetical protein CDL15_Pgr002700 [Punica granatum]
MGLQKIPLSAKVTNEMFGHIFGASCLSRDTRSPMDAFSDRAPGVRSTDKQTAPQNGPTGTQGPSKSMNKLQMTFRNPTRPPEECLSGHERLPASLREFPRKAETTTISERLTITPSTSRHSRHTEKIPVKVPRSSRAYGPRPRTTSQQSLTGQ